MTSLKKLEKASYQATFWRLGESRNFDSKLLADLEKLVCEIYGFQRIAGVDIVHLFKLKPYRSVLVSHINV